MSPNGKFDCGRSLNGATSNLPIKILGAAARSFFEVVNDFYDPNS